MLDRAQVDGPGAAAVRAQVATLRAAFTGVADRLAVTRDRLARADEALDAVAAEVAGR